MIDSLPDEVIRAVDQKDAAEAASGLDAVRCLYLAKAVAKRGHPEAARRWEEMAQKWLKRTTNENDQQISQFKIWLGGSIGGGEEAICFSHGQHVAVDNDSSMNESISLEEHEGELKLKPLGILMFGSDRDKPKSPKEIADYLWEIVIRNFS